MERHETKALLKVLSTAYPRAYAAMSAEEKTELMRLWHEMFAEYPGELVGQACRNYIKANEFPPTIAGLMTQIELLTGNDSTAEAFNALEKACRNGYYHSAEEFAKLPENVQRWLGDATTLKELAQLPPDKFATVVRGEFLKSYPEIRKKAEAQKALPDAVQAAVTKLLEGTGI